MHRKLIDYVKEKTPLNKMPEALAIKIQYISTQSAEALNAAISLIGKTEHKDAQIQSIKLAGVLQNFKDHFQKFLQDTYRVSINIEAQEIPSIIQQMVTTKKQISSLYKAANTSLERPSTQILEA